MRHLAIALLGLALLAAGCCCCSRLTKEAWTISIGNGGWRSVPADVEVTEK